MIQSYHLKVKEATMELNAKRKTILLIIAIAGFVIGRLLVRFILNLLLGGTMFGGNFL